MTTSLTKTIQNNHKVQTDKTIELKAVSKKYPFRKISPKDIHGNLEDFWALKDISLEVNRGEVLGIIGRNGAGKTTLLNIIAGILSPTEGERFVTGRAMGLFNLEVGFQDELTGRENIFLNGAIIGATKEELDRKRAPIIEFSELGNFIGMPLGTYSQGMRLRLGFSIVTNLDFDILVIDEALAVGDALFQDKCFRRLTDLKAQGKTLVITSQDMGLIERLADRVTVLDHGRILYYGDTPEGINRYYRLLNTERFFVGPVQDNIDLVEVTKRWAEDTSAWGKRVGTEEVTIESVELINRFGCRCKAIRSGEPLTVKASFFARDDVKQVHFGVAIFRNDWVYCYGPNTAFDGHRISKLKKGKGYFILNYHRLWLAPGEYKLSVAIWDKNETLAFDYHNGCYRLRVKGYDNTGGELLNLPVRFDITEPRHRLSLFRRRDKRRLRLSLPAEKWGKAVDADGIKVGSVRLSNYLGEEKSSFMTNESVKFIINFDNLKLQNKDSYLWLGIYRDDEVYCQGITMPAGKDKDFYILFPSLALLPGGYKASLGVWDAIRSEFLMCHHGLYPFQMVFNQPDHGTVYLKHKWRILR